MPSTFRSRSYGPLLAIVLVIAVISGILLFAGCGAVDEYNDERGRGDAPVRSYDDGGWDVINAPDRFPNVATRCNPFQPGTRLYIVTHGSTDVQPLVVPDEACAK